MKTKQLCIGIVLSTLGVNLSTTLPSKAAISPPIEEIADVLPPIKDIVVLKLCSLPPIEDKVVPEP
jgi:hypothetical protein